MTKRVSIVYLFIYLLIPPRLSKGFVIIRYTSVICVVRAQRITRQVFVLARNDYNVPPEEVPETFPLFLCFFRRGEFSLCLFALSDARGELSLPFFLSLLPLSRESRLDFTDRVIKGKVCAVSQAGNRLLSRIDGLCLGNSRLANGAY